MNTIYIRFQYRHAFQLSLGLGVGARDLVCLERTKVEIINLLSFKLDRWEHGNQSDMGSNFSMNYVFSLHHNFSVRR